MSTPITSIPAIMRNKKWPVGAELMDKWFAGTVAVAPAYRLPNTTTISMDKWVLNFLRAKTAYEQLVKERIWQNSAARTEIAEMLRKKGLLLRHACFTLPFGNLAQPVPVLDADYINQRVVEMTGDLDDMSAALGNFVFNVVVAGTVRSNDTKGGGFLIEISEVGVYVKDSYDFNGSQFLGFWDAKDNAVSMYNPLSGTAISNQDFRDWRTKNQKGGDFRIFSDLKRIKLTTPDRFSIP